jgi:hypothetical protein
MESGGPEAYFTAVFEKSKQVTQSPLARESPLGCDNVYVDQPRDPKIEKDPYDTDDEDLDAAASPLDTNTHLDATSLDATTLDAYPELAMDSTRMEKGFWRKIKKGASAAIRSYQDTGKKDRAAKKRVKAKNLKDEIDEEDSKAKSVADDKADLKGDATDLGASQDTDTSLGVGARYMLEELGGLMHIDMNTSLRELGSAYLNGTDAPNAYYANLALAATLGQLRLGVEHRLEGGAVNLQKLVLESQKTSVNKEVLNNGKLQHLRNIMIVFSGDANSRCTRPGDNDNT